jgi:hypothetical protein
LERVVDCRPALFDPERAAEPDAEEASGAGTWTFRLQPGQGLILPALLSFTRSGAPQ